MAKTVPTRQCIGCGEKKEKRELIRVVRDADGNYSLDATGRKNGRGAYLCPNADCLNKAWKRKVIDSSFKEAVPASVYEQLKGEFEELGYNK